LNRSNIAILIIERAAHKDVIEVEYIIYHIPSGEIVRVKLQQSGKGNGIGNVLVGELFPMAIQPGADRGLGGGDLNGNVC